MSITKHYLDIVLVKDRVLHSSITSISNCSFKDENQMTIPHAKNWHAVDAAVRIVLSSTEVMRIGLAEFLISLIYI
jgi:hypothetical protein